MSGGVPILSGQAKAAVEHRGGHVQIIASAGSGKTEVVAQRAAALVAEGVSPSRIVAFTFTKRAAAELKERIRARVEGTSGEAAADQLGQMFVGTIHAYSFRLLQTYVPRFETYDPLDENQLAAFLQREAYRLGVVDLVGAGQFRSIDAFARSVDVLENELLSVDRLEEPLRDVVVKYYATLDRYKLLTYGQQIVRAVEALSDPEIHARVAADVQHLIVDEYQDVNPAQERLVRLLSKPLGRADVAVVGDDDQAIYQWRGSDVQNIVTFSTRYPDVMTYKLDENRRSRPGIVDLADSFARTIPGRLPKSMRSVRETNGPALEVFVTGCDTEADEARALAESITELHGRGIPYAAMAVLVRGRVAYPAIMLALEDAGVPVQPGGRIGLFTQPEAVALGMTYAWLADRDWRTGRFDPLPVIVTLPLLLRTIAQEFGPDRDRLARVERHLSSWKSRVPDESRPVDLVGDYYEFLGLLGAAQWSPDNPRMRNRLGTLARFSTVLADYEAVKRRARPDAQTPGEQVGGEDRGGWYYRNFASLLSNYANGAYEGFDGEPDLELDAVDLTTVHGAKGLEWPIVFVPSLSAQRFPSSRTGRQQDWLIARDLFAAERYEGSDADERRLFYVALTRARDWVRLSTHERVTTRRSRPSPYLLECQALTTGPGRLSAPSPVADKAVGDILVTYSELQSFLDCGHAYRLRTNLGFMPALAPELGYGKAVHHMMRSVAEYTQRFGRTPDAVAVERLLATEFYLPYANKPAHREMKDAARRLVERYVGSYGEELHRVWATERPFELALDGIVVSGRADVIFDEVGGVPSRLAIVDYKTSTGPAIQPLQLQIYADAGRREGLDVAEAFVHDLKAAGRHDVPIATGDVAAAESTVLTAAERLRQRDFVPNPARERCAKCDVRALCVYG